MDSNMITRNDLNKALNEINDSYAGLLKKLSELEAKVNAQEERLKTRTSGSKRVQQTKANSESS
jgi:predicted nuclease with TOPRIM domain